MEPLYRLVYTSFRSNNCGPDDLKDILRSCRVNNVSNGITGVLIHSEFRFLQYLEGTHDNVVKLFEKIKQDPRHHTVGRRNFEAIDKRIFPSWAMAYKDLSDEKVAYDTSNSSEYEKSLEDLLNGKLNFDDEAIKILQLFFKTI
ncbi:MAG: BLUF domain-containing protein [Cyclobacteriaceae bacterium]